MAPTSTLVKFSDNIFGLLRSDTSKQGLQVRPLVEVAMLENKFGSLPFSFSRVTW